MLEECDREIKDFEEEKEYIERSQRAINAKNSETNQLIEEVQNTVSEFQDALSAELDNQPDTSNVGEQMSSNASIITFLMDFVTEKSYLI